jgi:heme exporter protein A
VASDFDAVRGEGLVKVYGATRALAGVSLRLDSGVVTVIEGPNGSGKSTLLSLLSQLARPTRGEIRYGALSGRRARATLRRRIGVLGHAAMIYPDLTGRENLELFARLYELDDPRSRTNRLIERFAMERFIDRSARTWSRGQLQRVALARSLVHSPRLLLLDEPSTGLDLGAVDRLAQVVEEERQRGAIIALITHDPALAERLADRRIRLRRGRVVEEASA